MALDSLMTLLKNLIIFSSYVTEKSSFPKPLSKEKEHEYLVAYMNGDSEAKHILIERNLRLVAHIAKKYTNYGDSDELISIGSIGLIKALESFKPDKGTQLATYASRCIENEILMLLRASKKYTREVSLYEPIGVDKDGEAVSLVDVIEMENKEVLEELILDQDIQELYEAYQSCLKGQEKEVIGMRYGLFGREPRTQREIASVLGISRSYVSRIEKKALGKLREKFEQG